MSHRIQNLLKWTFLLGFILFAFSDSFGQTEEVRLDSIYYYQFNSSNDSFPASKEVCSYSGYENDADCYNFASCISSRWDQTIRQWIPVSKNTERKEANGEKRIAIYYTRNQETEAWLPQQRIFDLDIGNLRETDTYQWDTLSNGWIHDNSFVHKFNDEGNQTLFESKNYWWNDQVWRGTKEEWAYDDDGRQIEHIYYNWEEEEGWIPNSRYTQSYNDEGYIKEITNYFWNSSQQIWNQTTLDRFTYNAEGMEIYKERGGWNNPQEMLEVREKWEKTYDPQGNLLLEEYSLLHQDINQWKVHSREEITYNSMQKIVLHKYYDWNWDLEKLLFGIADSFEYTPNGALAYFQTVQFDTDGFIKYGSSLHYEFDQENRWIGQTSLFFDKEKSDWIWVGKNEFPYGSDGKRKYYAVYNWDRDEEKWIGRSKSGYTYSENGYIKHRNRASWGLVGNTWVTTSSSVYDYGPCKKENLVAAREGSVLLYPNPVSESWLYVETELEKPMSYEILDLQGRRVLYGEMNSLVNALDVSELINGVYLLRCQSGDYVETKKFVIDRP